MEKPIYEVHKECLDNLVAEKERLAAENRQLVIKLTHANNTIAQLRRALESNREQ